MLSYSYCNKASLLEYSFSMYLMQGKELNDRSLVKWQVLARKEPLSKPDQKAAMQKYSLC